MSCHYSPLSYSYINPPPSPLPTKHHPILILSLPNTPFHLKEPLTLSCSTKIEYPLPKHTGFCSNTSVYSDKSERFGVEKFVDVTTLSNLCVDIVLNVPELPPRPPSEREAYMNHLAESPPDKRFWEAGGNCNMAIAAARLGLRCVSIGHVGSEAYGEFLRDVLHDEGINVVSLDDQNSERNKSNAAYETLVCWVLVDPLQQHGFCSPADFLEEPACSWLTDLSSTMKTSIEQSKILFCNGFAFDELTPRLLISAMEYAIQVGTSIFFDPGPRGKSLASGTPEEQRAFHKLLQMSDVLFLTSEEAESLTGIRNPILAGQELLRKGVRTKWVIIKTGPKGSVIITMSSIYCAPAFKVNVMDTVGCGDSFVAAVAFGFIHSMSLINTLTLANAVGSATAMGCGAGRNVATLKQVMELVKGEDLNEDDKFWNELLAEHPEGSEITMLSKMDIHRSSKLKHVSIHEVGSELLPELESTRAEKPLH